MSTPTIFWDIETEPLPMAELSRMIPLFEAPSNYKDPDKIAANISEQTNKWIEKAALSPISGRVLCIGAELNGEFIWMDGEGEGGEAQLLRAWKDYVDSNLRLGHHFCGFCTHSFDIGFLQKRAWANRVKPMLRFDYDPYRSEKWIDLAWLWNGRNKNEHTSLNTVARFLKVGEKGGEGKDFAKLWQSNKGAAIAYLKQDVALCRLIAERIGVVEPAEELEPAPF